jgi:hypothetical protein
MLCGWGGWFAFFSFIFLLRNEKIIATDAQFLFCSAKAFFIILYF